MQRRIIFFQDEGSLTRRLCEKGNFKAGSSHARPCACDYIFTSTKSVSSAWRYFIFPAMPGTQPFCCFSNSFDVSVLKNKLWAVNGCDYAYRLLDVVTRVCVCVRRGGFACTCALLCGKNVFWMTCLADPVATTEKPVQECCACGTAKYRVTFYGNWSEKVHPKDYPSKTKLFIKPPEY